MELTPVETLKPKLFIHCNKEEKVQRIRSYFHIFRHLQIGEKLAIREENVFISGSEIKQTALNKYTFGLANTIGVFLSRKINKDNLQKTITFFSNLEEKIEQLSKELEVDLNKQRKDKIDLIYEIQLLQNEIEAKSLIIQDPKDQNSEMPEIDDRQKSLEEERRVYLQNLFSQKKEIKKDLETGFQNLLTTYKTDILAKQLLEVTNSLKQKATAFCEKFLKEN